MKWHSNTLSFSKLPYNRPTHLPQPPITIRDRLEHCLHEYEDHEELGYLTGILIHILYY